MDIQNINLIKTAKSGDLQVISDNATKVIISDTSPPTGHIQAMLSAWNTLFQFRNIANSKFYY